MYLKFTHVDAATGIPCTVEPMRRGPAWPKVKGLKIEFGDQRNWPTNTPMFFGTCDDDADTDVKGVIGVLSQEQFEKEQQFENDNQASRVRQQRDQLLFQCDWTQAKDIPDTLSTPWATYRQALRDVPEQEGFPWNVQWPEQP
jgi:hypothetical protein